MDSDPSPWKDGNDLTTQIVRQCEVGQTSTSIPAIRRLSVSLFLHITYKHAPYVRSGYSQCVVAWICLGLGPDAPDGGGGRFVFLTVRDIGDMPNVVPACGGEVKE